MAPVALLPVGVGEYVVEAATDPQLGRMLEREHRGGVPLRMMLCRQLFCCHRGPGGKRRRGDARNQEAYRQYHGGGR